MKTPLANRADPRRVCKAGGRPAERAILAARLTDRPLRPLFPDGFRNEIQVVTAVMATDYDNKPELCSSDWCLRGLKYF